MTNIQYIDSKHQIPTSPEWKEKENFKNKGHFVDFQGYRYEIITKKEKNYSVLERLGRIFSGIWQLNLLLCCTPHTRKAIFKLFSKRTKSLKFALLKSDKEVVDFLNKRLSQPNSPGNNHEEIKYLQMVAYKAQKTTHIEGSRRIVTKISAAHNQQIFVKKPDMLGQRQDHARLTAENVPHEELAYLISELFQLHIVPFTISEKGVQGKFSLDGGVVIQKGILVNEEGAKHKNILQLQKVLLFNSILGRKDARDCNSVWTLDGQLFEIDNEEIGESKTDSWVFSLVDENSKLDKELIERISAVSKETLEDLLKKYPLETAVGIKNNLARLESLIAVKKDDLKIQDLRHEFYHSHL